MRLVVLVVSVMLLSACWDKVELENRAFVSVFGIDTVEEGFLVTVLMPANGEKSPEYALVATAAGLYPALQNINLQSAQNAYYGQTKAIVLGADLLNAPEAMSQVLDAMERNREISRKVVLLATDGKASDIVKAKLSDGRPLGMYIAATYMDKGTRLGIAFKKDLEGLTEELRRNRGLTIPRIQVVDGVVKLEGVALVSTEPLLLQGWLGADEVRGLMIAKGRAVGAEVFADMGGNSVPMRVSKNASKLRLGQDEHGLYCKIEVSIKGSIEGYYLGGVPSLSQPSATKALAKAYEQEIESQVALVVSRLKSTDVDALSMVDHMRKFNYQLFELHPHITLNDIRIEINANVVIDDIGAIS